MENNNWILKRISDSLNKNGSLSESDLHMFRVHVGYRKEFLELLSFFEEKTIIQAYLAMKEEIKNVDETEEYVKRFGCEHLLVNDDEENDQSYRCVRCGCKFDFSIPNQISFNNYILPMDITYDKARILYDLAVENLGDFCMLNEIVDEMRRLTDVKSKVYKK